MRKKLENLKVLNLDSVKENEKYELDVFYLGENIYQLAETLEALKEVEKVNGRNNRDAIEFIETTENRILEAIHEYVGFEFDYKNQDIFEPEYDEVAQGNRMEEIREIFELNFFNR